MLSAKMIEALRLAASRKSGRVSCGHDYPTAPATCRALSKRGLLRHLGSSGPYYGRRSVYAITDAGRAALEAA